MVQHNVDDDILINQCFSWVHRQREEDWKLVWSLWKPVETEFDHCNNQQQPIVWGRRRQHMKGPWNPLSRGPPNQIKRSPQPLDSYLCTVFCLMSQYSTNVLSVCVLSTTYVALTNPFLVLIQFRVIHYDIIIYQKYRPNLCSEFKQKQI